MRLLLVTSEPSWAESLRSVFPSDDVVAVSELQLAQAPTLGRACDVCFVAEAQTSSWSVDVVRQLDGPDSGPIFCLADCPASPWDESVLQNGAEQIFRRPLRGAILQIAVRRAHGGRATSPSTSAPERSQSGTAPRDDDRTLLSSWRDFSRLLRCAAEPSALIPRYLDQLRDLLRCGRILLYTPDTNSAPAFRCRYSSGVECSQFQSFRLSLRSGLLQGVVERGTALWSTRLRADCQPDAIASRELAVLGVEIAIPVSGSSGLAALLLVGPRICGTGYTEQEVAALYQSLEPMADLLVPKVETQPAPRGLSTGLLQAMPIATAVITGDLRSIIANALFCSLIGRPDPAAVSIDDLPLEWKAAVRGALRDGPTSATVEVEHRAIGTPRKTRLVLRRVEDPGDAPLSYVLTVEDRAPTPAGHDSDPHNIGNLLQRAGEQLSNEFRNALTPVDIMVQLSHDPSTSRLELGQLSEQVSTAIHRLRRRIDDLAYLTKSAIIPESTNVSEVLRATRERLDDWVEPKHLKRIVWLNEFSETKLLADSRALAVALAELLLNAIEASDRLHVTVTAEDTPESVSFRVRNAGSWEPPLETSGFRHRPFVSAKSTGVGLGLEVASRVAENHGGRLVIGPIGPDVVEAVLRLPRDSAEQPRSPAEQVDGQRPALPSARE